MLRTEPREINLKYIVPLSLFYITIYLAADSVAYKMVAVGNILEPGPPFIFPISYMIADVIAEVYGYSVARKLIWLTLGFQFLYAVLVTLVINLPQPEAWTLQTSYYDVFGHILRFVCAGTLSVLASSFINVYAISKWKILMGGKHFWLRSIGSSAIGGFVLVAVIMLFGYSWTVDFKAGIIMFFSIYFLELIYAFFTAWPAWLLTGYLKIKEELDVYDVNTNYNPFCLN